ncbi:MAG: hypothetical protein LBS06_04620 [Treponema sp.]|jgi:hypothetical protein|nr:hypothetical protein [Treponema sp.]
MLFFLAPGLKAEPLRVLVAGTLEAALDSPGRVSIPLGYNGSVLILLGEDTRFFKGVELELSAPQNWLSWQGSLAMALYSDLDRVPSPGVAELQGKRLAFELLPNKIQTVYQIPLRQGHGLRSSPYVTVPVGVIPPSSFPLLFRIQPVIKGLSEELEQMVFHLSVKPVLGDEGAVKISPRYPEQLPGRPFTVLIDDVVIENPAEERLIREGEHHLVILSDDYRNENRRFVVERTRVLDLAIELQDPTPLLIFEAPENARIFLDNIPIDGKPEPKPVEPGVHEIRFQVSDYAIVKTLTVLRGKTYRVTLSIDVNISENE